MRVYWICLAGACLGIACVQLLPALPSLTIIGVWAGLMVAGWLCLWPIKLSVLKTILMGLLCVLLGMAYSTYRAQLRLADSLASIHENKTSRVVLRVSEIALYGPDYVQFKAKVLDSFSIKGIPVHIQVRWQVGQWPGIYGKPRDINDKLPLIRPGQVWEMSLKLKRVHGAMNPNGFDYETHAFANNIRAMGAVKGQPKLLADEPFGSFAIAIERLRDQVRSAMLPYLKDKRYGPVMVALVMGDQNGIAQDDWKLFNLSGVTHLVSISGSHITMLAVLGHFLVLWGCQRIKFKGKLLSDHRSVHVLAAFFGLLVAWAYCLLAGWGVPAQRTLLMLAIGYGLILFRWRMPIFFILLLTCLGVLLLDPWAMLSSGFWLSFSAVAVLIWLGRHQAQQGRGYVQSRSQKMLSAFALAARFQLMITLALAPFLILLFSQLSLVSPLVNAYAIPLIGWVITPFSLLFALLALLNLHTSATQWLGHFTHDILQGILDLTQWFAQLPWASVYIATPALWGLLLALAGVFIVCQARGLPYKNLAWCFMVPVFLGKTDRPLPGYWNLIALDVGQGTAVVVLTQKHAVLFDAGPRTSHANEAGSRTILPYLRSVGIKQLDVVVVSHSDVDHAGGFAEVIAGMHTGMAYASFGLDRFLAEEEKRLEHDYALSNRDLAYLPCGQGQSFSLDGVSFTFLNNGQLPLSNESGNAQSCVLLVQGRQHNALLTGDIHVEQEIGLVQQGLEKVNVVVVPHHGASTSSSLPFIQALKAGHAIVQSGYLNRYGHPHRLVQQRWEDAGSLFWRTDRDGAVTVRSSMQGLDLLASRREKKRYWHAR